MKPNFRTCPQCSTRNRLDKEFCVKCGEPLEGVAAGGPEEKPGGAKSRPGFFVNADEQQQSPLVPLVLVLLTLGVAVVAWRSVASSPLPDAPQSVERPRAPTSTVASTPTPPGPGVAEYTAGMAALRVGDLVNAVRLLREAVAAASRPDFHLGLAEALEKSGVTAESLSEYEAAANVERNSHFLSEWARALNRAGRNTDAIRAYDAALSVDGDNIAYLREVVALDVKTNNSAKAREHLEKIVALQPDDLVPKQQLAQALELMGDLNGAATQYRNILAVMPGAGLSRGLLSEIYMKQNRPADALSVLDEGLKDNPSAAILHREKGRVLDRLGRGDEAVVAYREYLRFAAPGASDTRVFVERIAQLSPPQN